MPHQVMIEVRFKWMCQCSTFYCAIDVAIVLRSVSVRSHPKKQKRTYIVTQPACPILPEFLLRSRSWEERTSAVKPIRGKSCHNANDRGHHEYLYRTSWHIREKLPVPPRHQSCRYLSRKLTHSSLKTQGKFMIIIIDLWSDRGHAWKPVLHKFANVSSTWDHPSCKTLWATRDIFHVANGVPKHINREPIPKHTQLTLCHPAAQCVECVPITCQKMWLMRCEFPEHRGLNTINWLFKRDFSDFFKILFFYWFLLLIFFFCNWFAILIL